MSRYHRILNNLKNRVNDTLSKETFYRQSKTTQESINNFGNIKELNQLLLKELYKANSKIKTGSNLVLKVTNENIRNCKNKLEATCKPLYVISDTFDEKRDHYKRKYLESKHIRKEAEKLCQHLYKHKVYASKLTTFAIGLYLRGHTASESAIPEDVTPTADTEFQDSTGDIPDPIPKSQSILDVRSIILLLAEAIDQLNSLAESTFTSLELEDWREIIKTCSEYLHNNLGIEWQTAVALGALMIGICKMNNTLPQMQMIQQKLTEAMQNGDYETVTRYSQELMTFIKEKGLKPMKNIVSGAENGTDVEKLLRLCILPFAIKFPGFMLCLRLGQAVFKDELKIELDNTENHNNPREEEEEENMQFEKAGKSQIEKNVEVSSNQTESAK